MQMPVKGSLIHLACQHLIPIIQAMYGHATFDA